MIIEKIISGGQTGVDTAALDVAITLNIPHGGWCPRGRLCEAGIIPEQYQLQETETDNVEERTILNIRDSDATLVLVNEVPIKVTDGTNLTIRETRMRNKPLLIIDLGTLDVFDSQNKKTSFNKISDIANFLNAWFLSNDIRVLNIAGPRESQTSEIYKKAKFFLAESFKYFQCHVDGELTLLRIRSRF